jgi:hypothetical protein
MDFKLFGSIGAMRETAGVEDTICHERKLCGRIRAGLSLDVLSEGGSLIEKTNRRWILTLH